MYAWLYHGGKDSLNGPGIDIPDTALGGTLEIVHWYDAEAGADGGKVAIDALDDGHDVYTTVDPLGGYPGIAGGPCNGLQGGPAFTGSSGGWITSSFDLTPFVGSKIYLAFVFGSDSQNSVHEGWYIDRVQVRSDALGDPICQVTEWPGLVPPGARFRQLGGGQIEATWDDACNAATVPGQLYSIQAGSLDTLATSGAYSHAPVGAGCSHTSPATFAAGAGNEYYVIVANEDGREGSAGSASDGTVRPQTSATCGDRRVATCP